MRARGVPLATCIGMTTIRSPGQQFAQTDPEPSPSPDAADVNPGDPGPPLLRPPAGPLVPKMPPTPHEAPEPAARE